mgnify:CR=1 FL=1
MRKGWEYKKLGEVATYINGYAFKPDQWKESGTPIIRIQNLNNPNAPYNYFDGEVPEKVKIQNGDLLISWSASLGAYIWNGGKAFLNQHIFKVAFNKTDIDKFFLKYAVTSKLAAMAEQVHGATMKHIVKKDFDNTQIPYPPLSTQLAIVSELDKINELIRLKKEQLKDFYNLAQSLFYEMFGDPVENEKGWEVKKLGEIYTFIDYRGKTPTKIKSGIPLITAKNVKRGFLDYTIAEYISPQDFLQRQSRGIAQKGDLLFTTEAPLGNVAIANISVFSTGQRLIALQQKCELENRYVMFHMLTDYFQDVLKKHATGSTAQGIQAAKLKHIPIPLPPLSLQRLFAQRIEQIEREKSEVQKSIQDLETLLASRMQYWFE